MKKMMCEICGGSELIKQGDFFVCHDCGTKYTVEDAKKLMTEVADREQTVLAKENQSTELDNLYQLARMAMEQDNSENAQKYYEMILLKNPMDWEANFYSIYYKAKQTSIADLIKSVNRVGNCLDSVLSLIKKNPNKEDADADLNIVVVKTCSIMLMMAQGAINYYKNIDYTIRHTFRSELIDRVKSIMDILTRLIDDLYEEVWDDTKKALLDTFNAVDIIFPIDRGGLWEKVEEIKFRVDKDYREEVYSNIVNNIDNFDDVDDIYDAIINLRKLRNYKDSASLLKRIGEDGEKVTYLSQDRMVVVGSDGVMFADGSNVNVRYFYEIKSIVFEERKLTIYRHKQNGGYSYIWVSFNDGEEEKGRAIYNYILKKAKEKNMTFGSFAPGGCYVATCVYGSYDCPEVWTLRRYRDNSLGATWYGRAFIRIYYAISPTIVKWFGHTKWFKKMWKGKLDRMVKKLQDKGVENTPYNDKNWK